MRSGNYKSSRIGRFGPIVATAIVLLALLGDRALLRSAPAHAEGYHNAVQAAARELPAVCNSWLGVEVPVPQAAVKMLHPNVIISRRFHNISTDETVTMLLVHVKDARDVLGHYPPVCYTGQGWTLESARPVEWSGEQRVVQGTQYEFRRERDHVGTRLVVDNFFVMRGGAICRDMDAVEAAAQDRQRKFFGAAQVQFVHPGSVSPQRRRQVVQEFIRFMEPTFVAISAGEKT